MLWKVGSLGPKDPTFHSIDKISRNLAERFMLYALSKTFNENRYISYNSTQDCGSLLLPLADWSVVQYNLGSNVQTSAKRQGLTSAQLKAEMCYNADQSASFSGRLPQSWVDFYFMVPVV